MLSYLEAENTYTAKYFKPLQPLIDDLIHEMDGRLPAVEVSTPSLRNGYIYYDVRGPGDDYWDTYRRPLLPHAAAGSNGSIGSLAAAMASAVEAAQGQSRRQAGNASSSSSDELVLSQNSLSEGHTYWDVVKHQVSPDGRLVAYLYDTVGDEDFSLQVGKQPPPPPGPRAPYSPGSFLFPWQAEDDPPPPPHSCQDPPSFPTYPPLLPPSTVLCVNSQCCVSTVSQTACGYHECHLL